MGKRGSGRRRLGAIVALVPLLVVAFGMGTPPAFADYYPSNADVVGVGSDTVQYGIDVLAGGFINGVTGYNAIGNINRLINIDATADANARLAYSADGLGTGTCAPGIGGTAGTGGQTGTHSDSPCYLNPTVVLREGLPPVQRPNGSGAGYDALQREITAGTHAIDFSRSSVCQGSGAGCRGKVVSNVTSVQVANDPFAIMVANGTHAPSLSAPQLKAIYEASTPNCFHWGDTINGVSVGGTGTDLILPIIPQVGSGTISAFKSAINVTNFGNCGQYFEENDPQAIFEAANPLDAIEPMSGGRLNLYTGKDGNGAAIPGVTGFFNDPSCPEAATTPAGCVGGAKVLSPAVHLVTTGSPTDGNAVWNTVRPLYVYFRSADIAETAPYGTDHPFQPGSTLNWVRALFYNPCSIGQVGCITISGTTYGPGGQPYIAKSAGQALLRLSGLNATYVVTSGGP